jgi:hypothetical protein
MNVYQCDHCGNLAEAESQQISGEPKCVMGTHSWKILGKVGPNKWTCQNCNVTVKTLETPSSGNGKCLKDGSSSIHHKWKLIGGRQPVKREEKKDSSDNSNSLSESSTKNSSSFLDKMGAVGTVIKIIWFPFKVVIKISNWLGKLLGGSLFQ